MMAAQHNRTASWIFQRIRHVLSNHFAVANTLRHE